MCGILDDALPVLGAIAGTFIAPGIGTAIGAGLGGAAGNYAQTHNLGSALESGAIAGGTSYLGSALAGGSVPGETGLSTAGTAAANAAPDTLGAVESGAGGASLYGVGAGTGTALGSSAGSLGAGGLGIAGGSSLNGVGTGLGYLSGLGGSTAGTGLGVGLAGQGSSADLNSIVSGTPGGVTSAAPGPTAVSQGATGVGTPTTAASPLGTLSNVQTPVQETGSPMGFDQTGGAQFTDAGAQALAPQGSLSSMYGPTSLAGGSPQGALISQAGTDTGAGGGVQFGPLGQGTEASVASPTTFGDVYNQAGGNNTLFRLANSGLNAYQQFARQNAAQNYAKNLSSIFSPTGAYARQMQSNIARQYAAEGRNAEKGPQGVQLAAALAQAQAQAMGGNNYANAAQNISGTNALNSIFSNFATPQAQQGLVNLGKGAWNGLSSLWS